MSKPYEILEAPNAHWKEVERAVICHEEFVSVCKKVQNLLNSRDTDRLIWESDELQAEIESILSKAERV